MKVVILAGGLGTRLSEYTKTIPKPMIKVKGKPLIYHIMKTYAKYGFKDFYIALGYKGHAIKNFFKKNSFNWNINLIDTGRKNRRELSRAILDIEIDGVICSNTSIKHSLDRKGGLSGKLLFAKATESLVDYREFLGDSFPIMASGGVMDVDTYNKKIEAGANLVQVYTGMIYQGPNIVLKINEELSEILKNKGIKNFKEVIGTKI